MVVFFVIPSEGFYHHLKCFKWKIPQHFYFNNFLKVAALMQGPKKLLSKLNHWLTVSFYVCHLSSLSMNVINGSHSWMEESCMDDIHRWYFHPWMTFLHPWMTSTNNTFIHGGLNCRPSDFAHVSQSFDAILATIGNLCEQNVMDDNSAHGWTKLNHTWMEKPHTWMEA